MNAYVFSGPTLSHHEIAAELDAICLPPASQGDIYRASLDGPWAIGLIDGYFERVPAVWHKEILWAMSRGIHVFGAPAWARCAPQRWWRSGWSALARSSRRFVTAAGRRR